MLIEPPRAGPRPQVGMPFAFWSAMTISEEHTELKQQAHDLGVDWHALREAKQAQRRRQRLATEAAILASNEGAGKPIPGLDPQASTRTPASNRRVRVRAPLSCGVPANQASAGASVLSFPSGGASLGSRR